MKHTFLTFIFSAFTTFSLQAQPLMQFDQTAKELGTILWKTPRTATFKITNKGTKDLIITQVRTDCGCTDARWPRTPIGPGSTGTIEATYDAEMLGHFKKGLAVYTNVESAPRYLKIMGQVSMTQTEPSVEYPYQIGDYFLSTDNIEFDDVNRGDTPSQTLHIYNSSKKSYRPELMHLPSYLTVERNPAVIRPGRIGQLILTLNSEAIRDMGLTQTSIYLSRFPGDRVCKETEINVSTTLLPDFMDMDIKSGEAPVAQIDSTHITLGPLDKRGRANGTLIIRNTGKSTLKIKALQVYNPGISVSLNKRTIDADDAEKLKITVNSNNSYFKGRHRILLITNDPEHSKIVIDVSIRK